MLGICIGGLLFWIAKGAILKRRIWQAGFAGNDRSPSIRARMPTAAAAATHPYPHNPSKGSAAQTTMACRILGRVIFRFTGWEKIIPKAGGGSMPRIERIALAVALAAAATPAFAAISVPTPAPIAGVGIAAVALIGMGYRALRRRHDG